MGICGFVWFFLGVMGREVVGISGEGGSGRIVEIGGEGVEEAGAGDEDIDSRGELGECVFKKGCEGRPGGDVGRVEETLWTLGRVSGGGRRRRRSSARSGRGRGSGVRGEEFGRGRLKGKIGDYDVATF